MGKIVVFFFTRTILNIILVITDYYTSYNTKTDLEHITTVLGGAALGFFLVIRIGARDCSCIVGWNVGVNKFKIFQIPDERIRHYACKPVVEG